MNRAKTKREKAQLGRQLRTLRKKAGISDAQMAVYLEVSVRTILNYETGATGATKAVVLAYEHFTGLSLAGQGKRDPNCEQSSLFEPWENFSAVLVDANPVAA